MTDDAHLAHGLSGDHAPADWPALTEAEVDGLLRRYPALGPAQRIAWHSPRPLSAGCLVDTGQASVFVKRHHHSVRSAATLAEEHRFIAHLRRNHAAVPEVLADRHGRTAIDDGDWVYEVHRRARGVDLHRETISWQPLTERAHAVAAGRMLAMLHDAAEGHDAPQRATHILVARSELIRAADPVATLEAQLPERPGLADYLRDRDWQHALRETIAPWHKRAQPRLAQQPRLWTHGDWHVSNLYWSGSDPDARVTDVLDFGLSAANFALFDLATAIERNAIAWLELGPHAGRIDIAHALIEGYRQHRPLDAAQLDLLADLLPLVHVDFALSEVEYYHAITRSPGNADAAYGTFLQGHAAWFRTPAGEALLQSIRQTG